MVKFVKLVFIFIFINLFVNAQDAVNYQHPPKEIAELLLAKPTPAVSIDSKAEYMLILERSSYPTVEELGQPEVRVAGLRLNANNFSPSRSSYFTGITIKNIKTKKNIALAGLPASLNAANFTWSPDDKSIAFTNTTNTRVDLYIINIPTATVKKINLKPLNMVLGADISWVNNNTVIYKVATAAASAAPKKPITPAGPAVQENLGKTAPGRTYQDLIKNQYDEKLFEFLATSQIAINKNGVESYIGKPAIYSSINISPNTLYLLTETLDKPFSYLVPASGFASTITVLDINGRVVKELAKLPSAETRPTGNDNVQDIQRGFDWKNDEPATVIWCKPLDSGLIKNKAEYRDAVYAWDAPFTGEIKTLFKTKMRFRNIIWGNKNIAWVTEALTGKQQARVSNYNQTNGNLETLFERNITDAYGNPGNPVLTKNNFNKNVIWVNNNYILLNNTTGSSPKGDLPFLARFNLNNKESEIMWRCSEGSFEFVSDVIDPTTYTVITRKESQKEAPNYYLKSLKGNFADVALTEFPNPYNALRGVSKEKVFYTRADGIQLTGDLYLPAGYTPEKNGPLPLLIWAYPREFNSANDAAQVRGSQHRFTTLSWASPIYYVTQGFAVLDNAEMPIVSIGGDAKPNDNFIDQLRMNADAAINHLVNLGVANRNKVAVGGHSYGAFMTANLLAHTPFFKAGIARSGAYNRTLTPFGFQNEDRTYWQAPQLYYEMSPFSYANKIKTPLLLIHGEVDDNPGTFPINSERLYNAIKGHGGIVRYVSLPYEAHSYRGKENLLHLLWEQNEWLKKYVKEAKD